MRTSFTTVVIVTLIKNVNKALNLINVTILLYLITGTRVYIFLISLHTGNTVNHQSAKIGICLLWRVYYTLFCCYFNVFGRVLCWLNRFITKQTGHPWTVDHYLHGMMNQSLVFLLFEVCIPFQVLNLNGSGTIGKTPRIFDKMWSILWKRTTLPLLHILILQQILQQNFIILRNGRTYLKLPVQSK